MRRSMRGGAWAWLALVWTGSAGAAGYDFYGDWPTHVVTGDGTDVGVSVLYQYDVNRFSGDGGRFEDAAAQRRKYLGFYARKPGIYDINVQYDFQARQWVDTFVRIRTRGAFGIDLGHGRPRARHDKRNGVTPARVAGSHRRTATPIHNV